MELGRALYLLSTVEDLIPKVPRVRPTTEPVCLKADLRSALQVLFEAQGLSYLSYDDRKSLRLTNRDLRSTVDLAVTKLEHEYPLCSALPRRWEQAQELIIHNASYNRNPGYNDFPTLAMIQWMQIHTLKLHNFKIDQLTSLGKHKNFPNLKTLSLEIQGPCFLTITRLEPILKALEASVWAEKLRCFSLKLVVGEQLWQWKSDFLENDNRLDLSYAGQIVCKFPNLQFLNLENCVDDCGIAALSKGDFLELEQLKIHKFYHARFRLGEAINYALPAILKQLLPIECIINAEMPKLQHLVLHNFELPSASPHEPQSWPSGLQSLEIDSIRVLKQHAPAVPAAASLQILLDLRQAKDLRRLILKAPQPLSLKYIFDRPRALMRLEYLKLHLTNAAYLSGPAIQIECVQKTLQSLFMAAMPCLAAVELETDYGSWGVAPVLSANHDPRSLMPALQSLKVTGSSRIGRDWVDFLLNTFSAQRSGCRLDLDNARGVEHRDLTAAESNVLEAVRMTPEKFKDLIQQQDNRLYLDIFLYDKLSAEQVKRLILTKGLENALRTMQTSRELLEQTVAVANFKGDDSLKNVVEFLDVEIGLQRSAAEALRKKVGYDADFV